MADSDDGLELWLSAPLGTAAQDVTLRIAEDRVGQARGITVNGKPADFESKGGYATVRCHMPTWRDLLP